MADNRQSKRTPVTLKIKFKSETLDQFINRYAVDVSHGGIFIRTKDPLPVGTTMRFEFQLKDSSPLIKGEGTVVWTREHDPSRAGVAPGMGVRFDRLADGSRDVLEQILSRKANKSSSRGFVDMPTRVAPSPLNDLARGQTAGGKSKPLPSAVPFQSDVDDFASEAFDQATKVHSMADLAKLSAREEAAIQESLQEADDDDLHERRARADSEGPTRLVGDPAIPEKTLLYARGKPDLESRAETVPFEGHDLVDDNALTQGRDLASDLDGALASAFGSGDSEEDDDVPTRALQLPDDPDDQAYDPDLDDEPAAPPLGRSSKPEVAVPPSPLAALAPRPASDEPLETIDQDAMDEFAEPARPGVSDHRPGDADGDDEDDAAPALAASGAASRATAKEPPASRSSASGDKDRDHGAARAARDSESKSKMPLVLVAIVLIAALGAGAYFLFLRDKGSDTDQVASDTPSTAPETTATPVEIADAAPPEPADAAVPDAPIDASEGLIMDPDAPTVKIVVRTDPGRATAELIGTDQQGPTPMTFEVAEGQTYTVRLSKIGFVSQEVELDPAAPGPVRATLEPAPMVMRITSVPDGARVYVDGRHVQGETPTTFELPQSFRTKRRMKVAIRKQGYDKLNIMVISDFKPEGDTMVMDVSGTLVVATTRPSNGGSDGDDGSDSSSNDSSNDGSDDGDAKPDGDGTDTSGADGTGTGDGSDKPGDNDADNKPDGDGQDPKDPTGPTPDWAN